MSRTLALLAALFLTLFFTACSTAQWTKSGVDEARARADEEACRGEAQRRMGPILLPPGGATDPRFGAPMGGSQSERVMEAAQDVTRCMRAKGYSLTTEPK